MTSLCFSSLIIAIKIKPIIYDFLVKRWIWSRDSETRGRDGIMDGAVTGQVLILEQPDTDPDALPNQVINKRAQKSPRQSSFIIVSNIYTYYKTIPRY